MKDEPSETVFCRVSLWEMYRDYTFYFLFCKVFSQSAFPTCLCVVVPCFRAASPQAEVMYT